MVAPRKIMGQSPWKELMEMLKLQISLGAVDAEEGKIAQQAEFGKSLWPERQKVLLLRRILHHGRGWKQMLNANDIKLLERK